jgi:hypothetical protein
VRDSLVRAFQVLYKMGKEGTGIEILRERLRKCTDVSLGHFTDDMVRAARRCDVQRRCHAVNHGVSCDFPHVCRLSRGASSPGATTWIRCLAWASRPRTSWWIAAGRALGRVLARTSRCVRLRGVVSLSTGS